MQTAQAQCGRSPLAARLALCRFLPSAASSSPPARLRGCGDASRRAAAGCASALSAASAGSAGRAAAPPCAAPPPNLASAAAAIRALLISASDAADGSLPPPVPAASEAADAAPPGGSACAAAPPSECPAPAFAHARSVEDSAPPPGVCPSARSSVTARSWMCLNRALPMFTPPYLPLRERQPQETRASEDPEGQRVRAVAHQRPTTTAQPRAFCFRSAALRELPALSSPSSSMNSVPSEAR